MEIALKKFYNLFWNNKTCRNIFLLHKEILLEKNTIDLMITDYYLPRIVISNSKKQKKSELKISARSENIFIETFHKLALSEKKYLSEEKFINYIDKRYGETKALVNREHPELGFIGFIIEFLESVNEEFSLIGFLKKYRIVPEVVIDFQTLLPYIQEEFLREIGKFFKKEEVVDLFGSIDDISDIYNSVQKNSLIKANKQATDTLFDDENFSDRVSVFENLYEIGVLTGGYFKSYLECTMCLPKTFSGFFNCDIAPSKLKFKCPNCGKEVYYMVPYQIDRGLYEHIISKDGVLAYAIAFLLDKHKIKYEMNINLENKNEIDFVIKEADAIISILEIKMFRNDKSEEAKVKNILEAISQGKKTKLKLMKENPLYKEIEYVIIANYIDENIYQIAIDKSRGDLEKFNILIQ